MSPQLGLMGLMASALQGFADGWRTWGPLAVVLGAGLFAFTVVIVLFATGVGLWVGLTQPGTAQELPSAVVALAGLAGMGVLITWTVCWQLLFAGVVRLALREADHGTPPSLADLLAATFTDWVPVLAVTLFTLLVGLVGTCLCVLPGVLAGAMLVWALPLVIDQGLDPLAAMRASASQFAKRPWWTLGFTLLGTLSMAVLGQILPVIGPGVGQVLYALFLAKGYRQVFGVG